MLKVPGRFWWYRYRNWTPRWWEWALPGRGGDEFGRRTLIIHVPFKGFLVWAYRTCHCADCVEARTLTGRWQAYEAEQMELDELALQERRRWEETP
jgi:hypothetical protein